MSVAAENCNLTVGGEEYYNPVVFDSVFDSVSSCSSMMSSISFMLCISFAVYTQYMDPQRGFLFWLCLGMLLCCMCSCLGNVYSIYSNMTNVMPGSSYNKRPCWSEDKHVLFK